MGGTPVKLGLIGTGSRTPSIKGEDELHAGASSTLAKPEAMEAGSEPDSSKRKGANGLVFSLLPLTLLQ